MELNWADVDFDAALKDLIGDFELPQSNDINIESIATQQLFQADGGAIGCTGRYAKPVTDREFKEKLNSRIPKKTRQSNEWSVRVYEDWAKYRRTQMQTLLCPEILHVHICQSTNSQLNFWLARFVQEVRRQDGTPYPPNSLTQIIAGLQRHMRNNGCQVNLLSKVSTEFLTFRQNLDSRMKELTAAGVGIHVKQADPLDESDEEKLWTVFGNNTAHGLSYAVFFYNCKLFGLRGMDEHRDLQVEQFTISMDGVGKYISFIRYFDLRMSIFTEKVNTLTIDGPYFVTITKNP